MASFASSPNTLTFSSGSWITYSYSKDSQRSNSTFVQYILTDPSGSFFSNYDISFTASSTGITFDVNPNPGGTNVPTTFSSPGNTTVTSGTVSQGDTVTLYNSALSVKGVFTVPNFGYSSGTGGGGTSTEGVQTTEVATFDWDCKTCVLTVTILADAPTNSSYSFVDETNSFIYLISHTQGTDTTYSYTVPGCSATVRLSVPRPDGEAGPLYYTVKPCNKVFCNFW